MRCCQSKTVPVSLRRYRLQVQHLETCPKRKATQLSNGPIIGNGVFQRRNHLLPVNPSDLELNVYFQEGIIYSNLFQVLRFNILPCFCRRSAEGDEKYYYFALEGILAHNKVIQYCVSNSYIHCYDSSMF